MRNFLCFLSFLCLTFMSVTSAYATPQKGVTYTYETIPGSTDILRLPDNVLIPTAPTGATYVVNGTPTFVADPPNDDLAAYDAWVSAGNTATVYTPPPPTPKVNNAADATTALAVVLVDKGVISQTDMDNAIKNTSIAPSAVPAIAASVNAQPAPAQPVTPGR